MAQITLDDSNNYFNMGNLQLNPGEGAHGLNALGGNDTIIGSNITDFINGGSGDDNIKGNGGNDFIQGEHGRDTLDGGSGNDTILGGDGNDHLIGGSGVDRLIGNDGNDVYEVNFVNQGINIINDDGTPTGMTGVAGYTGGTDTLLIRSEITDVVFNRFGDDLVFFSKQDAADNTLSNYTKIENFYDNNSANDVENLVIIGSNQQQFSYSLDAIAGNL